MANPLWAGMVCALSLLAPAGQASGFQIVGGVPAAEGQFPFMAALSTVVAGERHYFCGASLIAEDWLLTAAHCFRSVEGDLVPADDLWAAIGVISLHEVDRAEQSAVAEIFVHPDFDAATFANDIALLRLAAPSEEEAVELAESDPRPSEVAAVIGFGRIQQDRSAARVRTRSGEFIHRSSDRLLLAPVVINENDHCARNFEALRAEPEFEQLQIGVGQICAGGGGTDSCQGDSGGPLLERGPQGVRQIGVVSFGYGCAIAGFSAVYTSAAGYRGWIDEVIAAGRSRSATGAAEE